jgi:hypothetical protein
LATFLFYLEVIGMFETEFEALLTKQMKEARGQRLEMLQKDLSSTKKMLEVLYPVLGTLRGLILEHEMVSLSGVKIYGDAFHPALRIVFEEENFVTHAEMVSRERFSFERARARSVAVFDYAYFPYSKDELDKKPEFCQRNLSEKISRTANLEGMGLLELSVYEREILRFALLRSELFLLADACYWLKLTKESCRKILRLLETKGYIKQEGGSIVRCHGFKITEKGVSLFHRG